MVDALRCGDLEQAGALLGESHASLRDDFEASADEIEILVEILCSQPGIYGARLTGGGFGGASVALADVARASCAAQSACREYVERTGLPARVVLP
jgi:galactokinase